MEREGLGCRVVIYFDMQWSLHNLFTLEIRMRNLLMLFWEICILCTITWLMKMDCRTGKICGGLSSQEEFQWLILPERLLVQFWSIWEHHTIQMILIHKLLVGRLLFSRIWHYWQTRYSYRNDIWSLHVIAWQLILFVKVCFFIHMNAYVSVFFSFSYIWMHYVNVVFSFSYILIHMLVFSSEMDAIKAFSSKFSWRNGKECEILSH